MAPSRDPEAGPTGAGPLLACRVGPIGPGRAGIPEKGVRRFGVTACCDACLGVLMVPQAADRCWVSRLASYGGYGV